MNSVVLSTHTPALFAEAVERAAELLRAGQLVALPTETVYGLAANAWDAAAVARIYEIKGRPARNPIIVHVAGLELARECVAEWPPVADKLAKAFWPGPLTLVLPRAPRVPDVVTAGGPTVGVRWPSHPFIQAVIRACGFPLAAPSANPASQVSPTHAAHVQKAFAGKIPLIVDGGPSQVGLESTVLDLASARPALLRPGMIHAESLLAVMGGEQLGLPAGDWPAGAGAVLRSPGLLPKHYSPKAKLVILSWRDQADLSSQLQPLPFCPEKTCIIAHSQIRLSGNYGRVAILPHDAAAFARALYAELHQCDESGAALIVVEAPPPHRSWRAIADRLFRAAQ
ncbi:MAG TPA: L-threonylcarbamoyladenylate synthase [Candidatus Acidoferrum sp.]|nr:L-threonylcarbamoyladenylate synthase [Candidatus Acidoferrum sp.]